MKPLHTTEIASAGYNRGRSENDRVAPSSDSGDLRDLVALEEEDKRLKNLLADRLREEGKCRPQEEAGPCVKSF